MKKFSIFILTLPLLCVIFFGFLYAEPALQKALDSTQKQAISQGGAVGVKTPNISFPETIFDFGPVYQGEKIEHIFKFKNIGDAELVIDKVTASCGCTAAIISDTNILPNGEGEIKATFNTAGYKGLTSQNINVQSNDPLNPTVRLIVKGEVNLEVEVEPLHLSLGDVPKHTQITKQFKIIQRGEQELLVDKVTVDNQYLKIDSVEKKESFGKNIYLVSVTLNNDAPVGNLFGKIQISTNLDRQKTIWTSLQAKILSHIKFSPERLTFKISPGANRVLPVILSTQGDNFEVLKVESNLKNIFAEIFTLEKFRKYRIDISINSELHLGPSSGNIKIYTNCPGETELKIPVVILVDDKKIEIGYFFERGCLKCERLSPILQSIKEEFPNVVLKEYDIESRENMELNEELCEIYGVPEEKRMTTPTIFIGKDFLIGESVTKEKLVELINKYKNGASLPLNETTKMGGVAKKSIMDRFRSFGIFAIIGAGLIDGFNPCAFATIIFFISYLAILKRKGKEIILVGTVFTLAVFITYLLLGMGIFEFLKYLAFLKNFTKVVYGVMAVLTLMLGVMSFVDYLKCRKGQAREMLLQLPAFLKNKIHSTIKEQTGLRRYVLAAFITGFIVSILELSCTGQVYLPTIVYATGISKLRLNAYMYLLIYNVMFILPLIIIFILAYFGTTSIRLSDVLGKNIALIKLLTSILFLIFAAFLVMMLIVPV